jgi:hypothetical protein
MIIHIVALGRRGIPHFPVTHERRCAALGSSAVSEVQYS